MTSTTNHNALIKIANVLIKASKFNQELLTESEKQILNILRDERIVRKNQDSGVYSLMNDPTHQSPTWG